MTETLQKCCQNLASASKITERRELIEQLRNLLDDKNTINALNKNHFTKRFSWDSLVDICHDLLLSMTKKKSGAKSTAPSSSILPAASSLFSSAVRKANSPLSLPMLKGLNLISKIMLVLSDESYSCVHHLYLDILLNQVLRERKYWTDLTPDHWMELFAFCKKSYKLSADQSRKETLLQILNGIVLHGGNQCNLGLTTKKTFAFLEYAFKEKIIQKNLATELLKLASLFCTQLAYECRTEICHLGETVVPIVLSMEHTPDKDVWFSFLLLQMKAHHPRGAREGEGAAFADNWVTWRRLLKQIYNLVETEIENTDRLTNQMRFKGLGRRTSAVGLSENLLQLVVAICRQVFMGSSNILEITQDTATASTSTTTEPANKRRRVAVCGLASIMNILGVPSRLDDNWAWVVVLTAIVDRYPDMVPEADFLSLLELMGELQSSCTDAVIVNYICLCLISLLKVEHHLAKNSSNLDKASLHTAWRKIWDTALRTVGLNQNAESSHKLLQVLLSSGTISQPVNLLQMFLSDTIKISEPSLKTLEAVLLNCNIPEETNHQCTRGLLLDWLLPQGVNLTMKIWMEISATVWARVLVELTLKRKIGLQRHYNLIDIVIDDSNDIEDGYVASAFESELLIYDFCKTEEKSSAASKILCDWKWKDKLFEALNRLYETLLETDLAGANTQLILKMLACTALLTHTLDRVLLLEVETWARIQSSNLSSLLTKLMEKVGIAANDQLKDALLEHESFAINKFLLNKFVLFFQSPLQDELATYVRKSMPRPFLVTAFNLAKTLDSAQKNGDIDLVETDCIVDRNKANVTTEDNPLMDNSLLSPREKLQFESSAFLASFSCQSGRKLGQHEKQIVNRFATHGGGFDMRNVADFQKTIHFLRSVSTVSVDETLPMEQIMILMQKMCKSLHKDGDAVSLILSAMTGLLKHISSPGVDDEDRSNIIVILSSFRKFFADKKYGPKVCVQYLKCLKELAKVDPSFTWACWHHGTKVPNAAADPEETPICEEALIHLSNPYHEVRMGAASVVATLFGGSSKRELEANLKWETRLFDKLFLVTSASFIIEGELSTREAADESANRATSVLHALAALIVVNPRCRRRALFFILQLVKEKNISVELIHKVLKVVGKSLKLPNIISFMEKNLNYLLAHWLALYELTLFPWKLVGCSSEKNFYTRYKDVIVPILLKKKDTAGLEQLCQKLDETLSATLEACFPSVMSSFLPCYATDGGGGGGEVTDAARDVAKWAHRFMEQALSKPVVDSLLTEHLCSVVVGIARLLCDPTHFQRLCGCRLALPDPDPPFFSAQVIFKTFKYLQENSPTPHLLLVEFLESESPAYIQTILLRLSTDIQEAPTEADRLTSLHRYCTFCDYLINANLQRLADFVIRDVTHSLVHLIKRSVKNEERSLAAASCHFLRMFCGACIPKHSEILVNFVVNVVGVLIPLTILQGDVGKEALALIRFLVITNEDVLMDAVKGLDQFPSDPVFHEVREVYERVNARGSRSMLEDDIKQFLKTGCKADGLLLIRTKLSEKKVELEMLYKDLEEMRGFSEDCENSVLHQLCCKLVQLTADSDARVSMEAACCLGELGPADLTTMVLKPEARLGKADCPLLSLAALAIDILVGFLVDEDISVVAAASDTLYALLASEEGMRATILDKKHSKIIVPFLSEKRPKGSYRSKLPIDEPTFVSTMNRSKLWCPKEECSHDVWITRLVTSMLQAFPQDSYLSDLIQICQVKVSFAEEILPLLVELVICHGTKECTDLISRNMSVFFSKRYERLQEDQYSVSPVLEFKYSKDEVCFNKASVQCMLNVVQFVRMQRSSSQMANRYGLDLNYLHVALAAQFCSAYFTSVLYGELWCRDINARSNNKDRAQLQNVSMFDRISENDAEGGMIVQKLFREAYIKLGDVDAVSGCGSTHLLDPHTRVRHYELRDQWGDAMLQYDVELSSGSQSANRGMLSALHKFGLHHILHTYQTAAPIADRDPIYFDCLWRLGQWQVSPESDPERSSVSQKPSVEQHASDYQRQHYIALKALKNGDETGLETALSNARQCIIDSLAHASLESSKSLYPALSKLQTLQEIEDFAAATKSRNFETVLEKWRRNVRVSFNDFSYREPILAQRSVMLSIAVDQDMVAANEMRHALVDTELTTASIARHEGSFQVAMRCFGKLHRISNGLSASLTGKLMLEEAELCWARGDQEVGKLILQSLLGKFTTNPPRSEADVKINSKALLLFGNWLVETKSENPHVIIEQYFEKSLSVLTGGGCQEEDKLKAYASLAHFADEEYQRVTQYLKSPEIVKQREFLEKARQDARTLRKENKTGEQEVKHAIVLNTRQSDNDEKEISNTELTKDRYLVLAMRYYMLGLEFGTEDKNNLIVFRFVALWLENMSQPELNRMLSTSLNKIPSFKFLPLLPQLAPRIGSKQDDPFVGKINLLLERCAVDHPHHTLPLILALALAFRDLDYTKDKVKKPTERVSGAKQLVLSLRRNPKISTLVQRMEQLSEALIELANYETGKSRSSTLPIPKSMKLMKLKNLECALVPTVTIPVRNNAQYPHIVGIHSFEENFSLVGGVNAPKKIKCLGSDGIRRPQLLKGKDDLRQDAVMQQVFTIMNSLLKTNPEARKDKLVLRTYKVVPLSQRSGILEWCEHTEPMGNYLASPSNGAHAKYHPEDLAVPKCRAKMHEAGDKSSDQRLRVYLEVTSRLHPVFHHFFLENFPTPGIWFERRLAYIHSVATTSMVGYILGLGDRHVQNILIDQITAEVIHIDFGVAFEQGKVLPMPENVPFRLTRDIEDGMGVAGVEGVFRRSCEKTMSVLRKNRESILTILEVLLYDPLYAWTITPTKAFNLQQQNPRKDAESTEAPASQTEVNKLAERALFRLQQKLQGTEEGISTSIAGQVGRLIQQARDPGNLSQLYSGWQAYL